MPREEIETYISHACAIRVEGKRTATEGRFRGVGLTEDGHASIVLDVVGQPLLLAYRLDEIDRIRYLSPATTGRVDVEMAESEEAPETPEQREQRLLDWSMDHPGSEIS